MRLMMWQAISAGPCAKAFRAKGGEFDSVVKMGRTQLQDAVPMTLGQEFNAFATTFEHDLEILERTVGPGRNCAKHPPRFEWMVERWVR